MNPSRRELTMNVRVYATLRPIVGGPIAQLSTDTGDTFMQLIDEMLVRWPALERELLDKQGALRTNIHIFLNGRDVRYLGGLEMPIPENADVCIFPPVGGGTW
jgi:sulfur-carrier protein